MRIRDDYALSAHWGWQVVPSLCCFDGPVQNSELWGSTRELQKKNASLKNAVAEDRTTLTLSWPELPPATDWASLCSRLGLSLCSHAHWKELLLRPARPWPASPMCSCTPPRSH